MKNETYVIDTETKKFVLKSIRNLEDYKKEKEMIEKNIIESSAGIGDGLPRGNQTSDPTASKAIQLDTEKRLCWLKETIKILENVYNKLNKKCKDVWEKIIVKNGNPYFMENELCMSRSAIYRAREYIIILSAIEMGLIKIKL